jgi:hypothetical protein
LIARRDESIDVIGMDHLQRNVPASQFLVRQAEVVESLLIRNNVAGVAVEYENVTGDRIDDRAQGLVGFRDGRNRYKILQSGGLKAQAHRAND